MEHESERLSEDGGLLESFTDRQHFTLHFDDSSLKFPLSNDEGSMVGINETGSLVFPLSLTYVFAAIINPTRIGGFLLNVDHDSGGIFNSGYWKKCARVMIVISVICISIMTLLNIQLGEHNSSVILFMGSLFLMMSFGQQYPCLQGNSIFQWPSTGGKLKLIQ